MKRANPYGRREIRGAFGATLRAARDKQGVTQDQLAIRCAFDRTYPSLLERGLRQPTLHTLLRLADALDIGATELVAETISRLRGAVQLGTESAPRLESGDRP
jgi:transcriptional regulator with XRE-family HTH domain